MRERVFLVGLLFDGMQSSGRIRAPSPRAALARHIRAWRRGFSAKRPERAVVTPKGSYDHLWFRRDGSAWVASPSPFDHIAA